MYLNKAEKISQELRNILKQKSEDIDCTQSDFWYNFIFKNILKELLFFMGSWGNIIWN